MERSVSTHTSNGRRARPPLHDCRGSECDPNHVAACPKLLDDVTMTLPAASADRSLLPLLPLEKKSTRLTTALTTVIHRELAGYKLSAADPAAPKRGAGIRAILAQRVKIQIELSQFRHVV